MLYVWAVLLSDNLLKYNPDRLFLTSYNNINMCKNFPIFSLLFVFACKEAFSNCLKV